MKRLIIMLALVASFLFVPATVSPAPASAAGQLCYVDEPSITGVYGRVNGRVEAYCYYPGVLQKSQMSVQRKRWWGWETVRTGYPHYPFAGDNTITDYITYSCPKYTTRTYRIKAKVWGSDGTHTESGTGYSDPLTVKC